MGERLAANSLFNRDRQLRRLLAGYFQTHFYGIQSKIVRHLECHGHTGHVGRKVIALGREQIEFRRLIGFDDNLQPWQIVVGKSLLVDKIEAD